MFAIYNNGSVGFRSTADNLYQIKNLDAPSAAFLKPDDDTLFQDYLNKEKKKNGENPAVKEQAVNAYKQMANLDISEAVYHVEDIMTRDIFYLDHEASIKDAYDMLKEKKVSQIPIVSFGKKIIGLISKKIILNLLIDDLDNSRAILNRKLKDLSLSEVITADPIADIRRVCQVMIDLKLDAMPVVNQEDIVVGMVSKTDIIKAVSHLPKLQLWS
ncbi:HPP family protein [Malaciobacter mytili]|uniref:CBS domain-containing protein n=1 Tax=Malaciobacter mytili LMG 24559 TaxID=1032238 RepID=A0AAX2AI15_9BACT|nr:CBS domain-containing protein [Malaciobacter mytili]AXH13755.1 CBS domain-containing protein [Malaciobacter mytili LMG 24559]RXK16364.1 CBS domain-containing protein [Malaciobacter mytili LMG 24559]